MHSASNLVGPLAEEVAVLKQEMALAAVGKAEESALEAAIAA